MPSFGLCPCPHLVVLSVFGDVEHDPHHQQLYGVRTILDVHQVEVRGVLSGSELFMGVTKNAGVAMNEAETR